MPLLLLVLLINAWVEEAALAVEQDWVDVPAGSYTPLFIPSEADPKGLIDLKQNNDNQTTEARNTLIRVERFKLQIDPVTNRDFLDFVVKYPEWQREHVKSVFADQSYLRHWSKPADVGNSKILANPVVHISWFAARSYCEWIGGRLPSTDEWEYVASVDDPTLRDKTVLDWYSQPADAETPASTNTFKGKMGIRNMYGKIWEWTSDFNSSLVTGESREDGSLSRAMFCGAGSIGFTKPTEYATFMRFALRNSLKGNYTLPTLGFRCAKDAGR